MMDLKKHAEKVGLRLSEILLRYDGKEGYGRFKKKEMEPSLRGKRYDWMYFYQLPSDSTMSVSFSVSPNQEQIGSFLYLIPGKTISWGTRSDTIKTGDLEEALKEFEERIIEIPNELKTIYKSKDI